MDIVNHSDVYCRPNGYYFHTQGIALCNHCATVITMPDFDVTPLGWDETDTPNYCEYCQSLIFEPLTTDGKTYVWNEIGFGSKSDELLECWIRAYSNYFPALVGIVETYGHE